ncbi:hypothetical protein [Aquisphaera insulae]|uniref:hypothetical protein n=1 Tax=Aquisphaera insulae TaxID=2712864 RepID=UPI0013ED4D8C|nr:hypothetical protein [Aquisphaera insulae]
MPRTKSRPRDQGKTVFVKEQLNLTPTANVAEINESWTNAGMEGSISGSLVNRMRSELGLTGNIRRGAKKRKNAVAVVDLVAARPGRKPGRRAASEGALLREIEVDLDRLLFKVMEIESLAKVEDAIRDVRRALFVAIAR